MTSEFSYKDIFQPRFRGPKVLPIIGSLFVNTAGFTALDYSLAGRFFFQSLENTKEIEEKQDETAQEQTPEEQCTPNPSYGQIIPEEKAFVDGLTADIHDTHLDSMSFGDFMIKSEVYVHNSEQHCLEEQWNIEERLQRYKDVEKKILAPLENEQNTLVVLESVFDGLHQIVLRVPKDYQARPLVAQDTGEYDCKAGTEWLTAVASAHSSIGDQLKLMVYDEHILSVFQHGKDSFYFENTDRDGALTHPKIKGEMREKESFVVEYLLARGVSLSDLPKKFQNWYEKQAVVGLIKTKTNTFGVEANVGVRSKTIDDELAEVPYKYPEPQCKKGACIVEFDAGKYDWDEIREKSDVSYFFDYQLHPEKKYWRLPAFYESLDRWQFALLQLRFDPDYGTQLRWTDDKVFHRNTPPDFLEQEGSEYSRQYETVEHIKQEALRRLWKDIINPEEDISCISPWITLEGDFLQPPGIINLFRLYSEFTSPTVSQLEKILAVNDHLAHCRISTATGYITLHYNTLQKQEGGPELLQKYKTRTWNNFSSCILQNWDCEGTIFYFAFRDPALLKEVYALLEENQPNASVVDHILRNLPPFYRRRLEVWNPVHAYLERAFSEKLLEPYERLERDGTSSSLPFVKRFCDEFPESNSERQQAMRDLYLEFCTK